MIRLTKDNKGITLITLIIMVILMLILVSVTAYSGIDIYKNAQVTKFITQMQLVQAKVDELKENESEEELLKLGTKILSDSEEEIIINKAYENKEITNKDIESYRYFSLDDLKNELNLDDGINGEIMINFITREVVSTMGTTYNEIIYYTQYLLPGGQGLINNSKQTDRDLGFDLNVAIDGLNATIIISNIQITNATLSYREQGKDYWETITNYTERNKEYSILLSKTATYEFKLTDNTTGDESEVASENIVLTNKPKTSEQIDSYNYSLTSENWAYNTDTDGNNYVWIPRFTYNTDDNGQNIIKFLKGNSSIPTDNSIIDETWTVSDKFNSADGTKLTGIWVRVTSKNQAGIDMIDLLNSDITILTTI